MSTECPETPLATKFTPSTPPSLTYLKSYAQRSTFADSLIIAHEVSPACREDFCFFPTRSSNSNADIVRCRKVRVLENRSE